MRLRTDERDELHKLGTYGEVLERQDTFSVRANVQGWRCIRKLKKPRKVLQHQSLLEIANFIYAPNLNLKKTIYDGVVVTASRIVKKVGDAVHFSVDR